jgi:hypothetical protein
MTSLRRAILLLGPLTVLGVLVLRSRATPAIDDSPHEVGVPRLTLVDPAYDWGRAELGGEIAHTFRVRNTGTAPLHIKKTRPT